MIFVLFFVLIILFFVDINFYNDFEVFFWWFLMYLLIFLKYICLDNGFIDIGLFFVYVWLGVF